MPTTLLSNRERCVGFNLSHQTLGEQSHLQFDGAAKVNFVLEDGMRNRLILSPLVSAVEPLCARRLSETSRRGTR